MNRFTQAIAQLRTTARDLLSEINRTAPGFAPGEVAALKGALAQVDRGIGAEPTFAERSDKLRQLRAEGKAGLSYNIQIDEEQRVLLTDGLRAHDLTTANEELSMLLAMLVDLPKEEAENPGICHGLCL